jgi:hypothetical protein
MEKGTIGAAINAIDAIQNVCYVLNSQPGEDVRDAARRTVDEKNDMRRQRDEALARAEKAEGLLERLREASLLNYYKETDFDDACLAESVFDTLSNAGYDMSSEAADRVFGSDK